MLSRPLVLLLLGQGVSRLGDGLYFAAVAWFGFRLAGATGVAAVTVADRFPAFVSTVLGAPLADRMNRRRLMIASDLARVGLLIALGLLAKWTSIGLLEVSLLVGALAVAGGPFAPARNALVPDVVAREHLVAANGLLQASFRSAYQLGPFLLAPLLRVFAISDAFLVDAVSFAVSALTLSLVKLAPPSQHSSRSKPSGFRDAFAALHRARAVAVVIGAFIISILFSSGFLSVGLAELVHARLHGGATTYGILLGTAGAAEIFVALLLVRVRLRSLALAALAGWCLLGIFRSPLGLSPNIGIALGLLAGTGAASALTDVPLVALIQREIPREQLAKVFGLWEGGIVAASALASPLAALLLTHLALPESFAISGIAICATASTGLFLVWRMPAKTRSA